VTRDRWLIDALGRRIPLDPEPRRILSLVPSVTECLFDLGVGRRVVGRTAFCISPPEQVGAVAAVGGPKTVDQEAAARLRPDLVLANAEENDRKQVEALIARGLRVHVAFPRTIEQAARFLEDLGELVRVGSAADRLAGELRAVAACGPGTRTPAACLVWKNPYITVNSDTLTSALLETAGAENVFAGLPVRYPAVSASELAAARPRIVLLPSEPYPFGGKDADELQRQVPGAAPVLVQGEWLTWYGSRMPEAIESLRRLVGRHRP
jgi:iron complex transport system substrate-binding protein